MNYVCTYIKDSFTCHPFNLLSSKNFIIFFVEYTLCVSILPVHIEEHIYTYTHSEKALFKRQHSHV